jgi:DNA invertase Pin-like site-specific DNA recombinase
MPTVTKIPATRPLPRLLKVAAYCRVSSHKEVQEHSLDEQVRYYTEKIKRNPAWTFAGVFADQTSGANISGRDEFQRLLYACEDGRVDVILTKSIGRFGRNTVEFLETIHKLNRLKVDVLFETENLRISDAKSELLISIMSGYAQASSEARSESIRKGIQIGLQSGKSQLYTRPCFGYRKQEDGELCINDDEAKIVRQIFDWYLAGHSVVSIIKELAQRGISSPFGKEIWSKRSIENLLQNEKYIGQVICGKSIGTNFPDRRRFKNNGEQPMYTAENSHAPIISREQFEAVQAERARRCNVEIIDGKPVRKAKKHSTKRVLTVDVE